MDSWVKELFPFRVRIEFYRDQVFYRRQDRSCEPLSVHLIPSWLLPAALALWYNSSPSGGHESWGSPNSPGDGTGLLLAHLITRAAQALEFPFLLLTCRSEPLGRPDADTSFP